MQSESFDVSAIEKGDRLRAVDPEKVRVIAESISQLGLRTPITIYIDPERINEETGEVVRDTPVLVAGAHRLEAVKLLGIEEIDAYVVDPGDEARLWEIAENLHRSGLTVQERADHIAEWVRITDSKLFQDETVSNSGGRGREGGVRAAARELGIAQSEAHRAVKIAAISPEAREAADEAGLHTQKARLEIAKADDQVAKVAELRQKASDHKLMESAADNVVVKQALTDAAQRINDTMPVHEVDSLMAELDAAKLHKLTGAIRRARTGVRGGSDRPVFDSTRAGRM